MTVTEGKTSGNTFVTFLVMHDIGNEKTPGEQCGSLCIDTNCAVTLVTLKEFVT